MQRPTKEVLIEILQAIPDKKEMRISDFNVIFRAYEEGVENGQCGFDASADQVFKNPSEVVRVAYDFGFKYGREN